MAAENFLQNTGNFLQNQFVNFIPNYIVPNVQIIISVILLLIIAFIVGRIVKFITTKFLGIVGLKRATTRTWTESFLRAAGYRGSFVELIGDLIKWLVYILFFALIIQTIGLSGLADIFTQVAVFMPRFIVAILLIVVGLMVADFFGKIFEEAGGRFLQEETMGKISGGLIRYSVALVIITMALALLGLDVSALLIMIGTFFVIIISLFIFGIKDNIQNFSAGLHLRNVVNPGDKVKFESYTGEVVEIDPISTKIKTSTGIVIIPNSVIVKNPLEKLNKK